MEYLKFQNNITIYMLIYIIMTHVHSWSIKDFFVFIGLMFIIDISAALLRKVR